MPNDKLKSLDSLLKVFNADRIVTSDDVTAVLAGIMKLLATFKKDTEGLNADTKAQLDLLMNKVIEEQVKLEEKVNSLVSDSQNTISTDVEDKLAAALKQVEALVAEAKAIMPTNGKDANPADVVPLVLEQIKLPEQKDIILDGGEIVGNINELPTDDDDLKIDAAHIKGWPRNVGGGLVHHGGMRNITVYDESTVLTKALTAIKFAGAGVQATLSNGIIVVTITGSASSEANGETLTDSGTHVSFTFAHAPSTGGVRNVWRKESGQLLTPTTDYTISGSTLTATSAQIDGDGNAFTLIANYTY